MKSAKEYIYVGKNLNWVEAVSECRSMNAELALIESEEQNKKGSGCKVHGRDRKVIGPPKQQGVGIHKLIHTVRYILYVSYNI